MESDVAVLVELDAEQLPPRSSLYILVVSSSEESWGIGACMERNIKDICATALAEGWKSMVRGFGERFNAIEAQLETHGDSDNDIGEHLSIIDEHFHAIGY